jgi:predicted transglutaminase-like cysteine proteinase
MCLQNLLKITIVAASVFSVVASFVDADSFPLSKQAADEIRRIHGNPAIERIRAWKNMMATQKNLNEVRKLELVNDFFNKREFVNDLQIWNIEDYWATPIEFLSKGAGDCEDYSIAKYLTLREMDVSDEKLRITYVRATQVDQAHMVVTYSRKLGDVPLVLDNLDPKIKPATERKDLRPIYSFNGSGLWLAKERGSGKKGRENRLSRWSDLIDRMK